MIAALVNNTANVVGFGRLGLPRSPHFLVVVAGEAGNDHQKRMILEGLRPSKPPCADDHIAREKRGVIYSRASIPPASDQGKR
jgi:hypothetical protein